jgi:hypothetical protein
MKVVTADPSRDAAEVLATAGIDNAHVNRLVVLGPAQFSLRNGTEQETMDALRNLRTSMPACANWSAQREIHCGTMEIRFTCRLVVGVVR